MGSLAFASARSLCWVGVAGVLLETAAWGQLTAPRYDQTREGFLVFHPIRTDAEGKIISWADPEPGRAFDIVIGKVWDFWIHMRRDPNGLPYYMNHQVWRPLADDPRGLGGGQFAMALSSWRLLYQYTGSEEVMENMKFIADYYITHGFSPPDAAWPNLPFPYNCLVYSGRYDGDMILGPGYLQPDKAGEIGSELVYLYKMTGNRVYLDTAVKIADTLAGHTRSGDGDRSPLPFKVHAFTSEAGALMDNRDPSKAVARSEYTSNWSGSLELFEQLIDLNEGETAAYRAAFDLILQWMKDHPLKTQKWGPFFEDIPGWSDTQINAVTFARFILLHRELFPAWREDVRRIFDWVYERLGDDAWSKYGVRVVREQTAYETPGNSHTSRQAAAELLYAALTGEEDRIENALRQLLWATYTVAEDGRNCYPRDEVWLTDGYGDYVRHFLRAMAARPELAPSGQDHLVHTTSVISRIGYAPDLNKSLVPDVPPAEAAETLIFYRTFEADGMEILRLRRKPSAVRLEGRELNESESLDAGEGWNWRPLSSGGVLCIRRENGKRVKILRDPLVE